MHDVTSVMESRSLGQMGKKWIKTTMMIPKVVHDDARSRNMQPIQFD